MARGRRIKELQGEIATGARAGGDREKLVRELDALIASACVLCSEIAIKQVDEPFISAADDVAEWAL